MKRLTIPSLASGASSASIQTYMNGVLGCSCVTVTGAVADRTYKGEGFVVGPGTGSKSLTLGTSDGATQQCQFGVECRLRYVHRQHERLQLSDLECDRHHVRRRVPH